MTSTINQIVKRILSECRQSGKTITQALTNFLATTTLDPSTNKFYSESELTKENEDSIVEKILKILEEKSKTPNFLTKSLQIGKSL